MKSSPRWATLGAVALVAAGYLFVCGRRRLLMGLAFAYTGGFEVYSGRLPYRDFHIVIGPVIFLLQGLFFKIFGVNYAWGYLGHAATLNAVATVMICDAVQRRTGRQSLSIAAAALTAVWFYPIYHASPWYDNEAFFFLIASVWMIERARTGRAATAWLAASGSMAAVAFFTKQSTGAAGLAGLSLTLLAARGARKASIFVAGATAALVGLGALCYSWAGSEFFRQFLILPMRAGRLAYLHHPSFWTVAAAGSALAAAWRPSRQDRWFVIPFGLALGSVAQTSWMYLILLAPLVFLPLLTEAEDRALLSSLVLVQLASRLVSNNEIKLFWPFIGLLFSLVAHAVLDRRKPWDSALERLWIWSLFGLLLCVGGRLSYWRTVWSPFPMTSLFLGLFLGIVGCSLARRSRAAALVVCLSALAILVRVGRIYARNTSALSLQAEHEAPETESAIPALRGIKMLREEAASLDKLVNHIKGLPGKRKRVFLYLGCEFIYPLLGQTLPQPILWFDRTLTFHPNDGTEARVLADLQRNKVGTIILCKPYEKEIAAMPSLQRLLRADATLEYIQPLYEVYRINPRKRP